MRFQIIMYALSTIWSFGVPTPLAMNAKLTTQLSRRRTQQFIRPKIMIGSPIEDVTGCFRRELLGARVREPDQRGHILFPTTMRKDKIEAYSCRSGIERLTLLLIASRFSPCRLRRAAQRDRQRESDRRKEFHLLWSTDKHFLHSVAGAADRSLLCYRQIEKDRTKVTFSDLAIC